MNYQEICPPSAGAEALSPHQFPVEVDLGRGLPSDPSVDAGSVVRSPPTVELSAEVPERTEVDPPDELLREDPVEPLELPSTPWIVGSAKDHRDASNLAVVAELLRDETTPVVHVDGLGRATVLERPPEVVGGLPSPLSEVGASHHQVSRTIVQDGVNVHVSSDAGDAELVDVHLPERVDVVPLEALERLGLLDDPDHEPMPLQHSMDRDRADLNAPPAEKSVEPQTSPGGVLPSEMEDPIDQVPVDPVRAMVRTPRLVPESLDAFFSVVSAPTPQRAVRDTEDPTDLRRTDPSFQVLLDGL